MALEFIVFNVERGLAVFLRTPNNYGLLIDCGSSSDFSPVQFLSTLQKDQNSALTPWNNSALSYFIVTHPHSDHITDIELLHRSLKPNIIIRRKDIDWARVKKSNSNNVAFDFYRENFFPPKDYGNTVPLENMPSWGDGMTIASYPLGIKDVEDISINDNAYVNNSSLVIIVKYKGYTFAITGDIEAVGLERLLSNDKSLSSGISGTAQKPGVDFLVCPHHGHSSGFCQKWFDIAGPTRVFNIVSERRKSENEDEGQTAIDSRYSDKVFSLGSNRADRKMVSTKSDGHIFITINDNGNWRWKE